MTEEKYEILISINIDCQCKMIDKWHDCNHAHMHMLSVSGCKKASYFLRLMAIYWHS